ncbi:hypothetical protein JCM10296v2_005771 [Rhodotorula toruloides]
MSTVPQDHAQATLTALVRHVPYLATWRGSLDVKEIQRGLERGGREGVHVFVVSVALLRIAGSPSSIAKRGAPVLPNTHDLVTAIEDRRLLTFNLPPKLVRHVTQTFQHRFDTQARKSNAAEAPELWMLSEAANAGQQHSLFKPSIGRRVARMHGTTKEEWERRARAF